MDNGARLVMSYITNHWAYDPYLVVVAVIRRRSTTSSALGGARIDPTPEQTRERRRRSLLCYAGLGILLVAVVSPIGYLSDDYFFMHMIQHILIMFFAPILVVVGTPWLPLAR